MTGEEEPHVAFRLLSLVGETYTGGLSDGFLLGGRAVSVLTNRFLAISHLIPFQSQALA